MKKDVSDTVMDRLNIDRGVRDLIRQMWEHDCETKASCEGHGVKPAYVLLSQSGDGWFEKNAHLYGLRRALNGSCCESRVVGNVCGVCGAGIRGNSVYRGRIVQNPVAFESDVTEVSF
ncbi:hypothetical protein J4423_00425 [Candidatus Pacearchaeota archaeon]|nr:hypothetical protein [Candidatus Pacearchaeota archaeon]